ncbi:MAG: response regulator [Alphaproteobacteria bacterium]
MKILIADDHALFRGGLRLQLQDFDPKAEILETEGFDGLLVVAEAQAPGMVIADLGMPGRPWREALVRLREMLPECLVVVLSATDDDGTVREAIRLGANGFISKSDPPEVVMASLRLVSCGGACVPPNSARRVDAAHVHPVRDAGVTSRQKEVLALIAEGLSNKLIAHRLKLTEGTVKLHVAAILKCLGNPNTN